MVGKGGNYGGNFGYIYIYIYMRCLQFSKYDDCIGKQCWSVEQAHKYFMWSTYTNENLLVCAYKCQKRKSIQFKLAHVDEEQIPPSFSDCIDKISLSIYVYDAF